MIILPVQTIDVSKFETFEIWETTVVFDFLHKNGVHGRGLEVGTVDSYARSCVPCTLYGKVLWNELYLLHVADKEARTPNNPPSIIILS